MPRRVSLPMSSDPRLSLARAREQLGGRAGSHGRAGEIVAVGGAVGVVVCSDAKGCDVFFGEGKTRRVAARDAEPVESPSREVSEVADDARAFARLEEGQDVVFDREVAGRLIEKCRYGGLVARRDGRIFAVGFRRFERAC